MSSTPIETKWIQRKFPFGFRGFAVDVGANDGIFLSITLPLEQAGWRVLCIEPNPHYEEALRASRREVQMIACDSAPADAATLHIYYTEHNKYAAYTALRPSARAGAASETAQVKVMRLDDCLTSAAFPRLDALCIDVEGNEDAVLAGFSISKWLPQVIVIENWTHDDRYAPLLSAHGYQREYWIDYNELWSRNANSK